MLAFFERLSSKTRRRRFHTDADHLSQERKAGDRPRVGRRGQSDRRRGGAGDRQGWDGTEHIVGVARLARPAGADDSKLVEAAVVVQDDFQGQGVGTELMFRMVLLAKQMGVGDNVGGI